MKKITLLVLIAITLCIACKNEPKIQIPAGWQTLKHTLIQLLTDNSNYEIEISAPSDWRLNNELKADDFFPSYFLAYPKDLEIRPGEANAGITVTCTSLPYITTGEQMAKDMNGLGGEAAFKIEEKKDIIIDGKKCERYVVDLLGTVNNMYFFPNSNNTIIVSFNTTNRKVFNEKGSTIDSIAERIRFVKK